MAEPGSWHQVKLPKFSDQQSSQATKTQIRRYQHMKKVDREWDQKYYKEKARSIRILQADTMRVTNVSPSTKLVLALIVESTIRVNGKGK